MSTKLTWKEKEQEIVREAVKRSSIKPVKALVSEVADTLGRSEQSVRNRFYKEKKFLESRAGLKFDKRTSQENSNGSRIGIYGSLEHVTIDLENLRSQVDSILENLETALQQVKMVEDWAKDTVEIKKMLSYTVDGNGVVERIKATG